MSYHINDNIILILYDVCITYDVYHMTYPFYYMIFIINLISYDIKTFLKAFLFALHTFRLMFPYYVTVSTVLLTACLQGILKLTISIMYGSGLFLVYCPCIRMPRRVYFGNCSVNVRPVSIETVMMNKVGDIKIFLTPGIGQCLNTEKNDVFAELR